MATVAAELTARGFSDVTMEELKLTFQVQTRLSSSIVCIIWKNMENMETRRFVAPLYERRDDYFES